MIEEYETTEQRTSRFLWLLRLPGNKNKVLVHILKDTLDMRPKFGLIEINFLHKASPHYITLSTYESASAKTTTTSLLAQAAAFQKWWDHCWIISKAPMYFSGSEKTMPCQIVSVIITDAPCTLLSHSSSSPYSAWKGVLSVNIATSCRVVLYTKHVAIFFLLLHVCSLVHIAYKIK